MASEIETTGESSSKRASFGAGAALAGVVALVIVGVLEEWPADAWAAVAAWVTAGVALTAGLIAWRQLGEARRLRLEQAQPYVVVYLDASGAGVGVLDLVVRNFGTTAAVEVRLAITPAPQRAAGTRGDEPEDVLIPTAIPVLVPGQEWRTLWDTIFARHETDLPDHHEAVVTFSDSKGSARFRLLYVLDWAPHKLRDVVTVYGPHHAAEALRKMAKTLDEWKEGPSGGLAVVTRDGDAKDEPRRPARGARLAAGQSEDSRDQETP